MNNQTDDDGEQRDKMLLRLLKAPPQPRPKRERVKTAKKRMKKAKPGLTTGLR